MTDVPETYRRLDAVTAQIKKLDEKRDTLAEEAKALIVALLKADEPPTAVAKRSPFSAATNRTLARIAGLPPAPRGGRKATKD
jgi:hypothetical protein